jgi:hypothetical protein
VKRSIVLPAGARRLVIAGRGTAGIAEIRATLASVPGECSVPAVFVSPDARPNVFFAVTGA